MDKHVKTQLVKFNLYGFFKNLKFFDPFLVLYLTYQNFTLAQIGFLWAIREAIIYLFEIPSGVMADKFGRKLELVICFIFYILSFIFFFIGGSYYVFVIAFILFGLGEAFRSGTHKAMIMDFMDHHDLKENKSKIYGKTRSYSLIGSTVSSLLAIILIQFIDNLSTLFLIAIIPYIVDMLLIISYPNYLNSKTEHKFSFKEFYNGSISIIKTTMQDKSLRRTLIDSASYGAMFKTIKDYIQVLLLALIAKEIGSNSESITENYLAIIYAGLFLLSSIASRYSHTFTRWIKRDKLLSVIRLFNALITFLIVITNNMSVLIIQFAFLYVLLNIRKPLMIEKIGEISPKKERASVLSVESQLTSIFIIVFAPLLGLIYDNFGVKILFTVIACIYIVGFALNRKEVNNEKI